MHILLVSSAVDSSPSTKLFKHLDDVTLHKANRLESLLCANTTLDLIFFDATLGIKEITLQIQFYQQNKLTIKWLVMNTTDIQQSLLYLQLGASGVLTQPSKKTLQDCFFAMSNGQLYLETHFIQILALRHIKKTLLPFKQLTAREYDVFCLLSIG